MDLGEAVIVAGIGCRKGTTAAEIGAAIDAALAAAGLAAGSVALIATADAKRDESGIAAAAAARDARLVLIPRDELEAAGVRVLSRSPRALAAMGVPSVAEAAALAAAGATARLLGPRLALGPATCALVETRGEP
jgi:cobalt-precorrin 5A hydrolase